jgi:hypothetical protein
MGQDGYLTLTSWIRVLEKAVVYHTKQLPAFYSTRLLTALFTKDLHRSSHGIKFFQYKPPRPIPLRRILLRPIPLHPIPLHPILLCPISLHPILLCPIPLHPILLCPIPLRPILLCPIVLRPITISSSHPRLVLSCSLPSCLLNKP